MKRRLTLCLMILLAVIGCQPDRPAPLRLGISPWPGYEPFFLAQELGFYRQANLPIQLVEFSSLGDSRRAYEQGLVDGIGTTLVEVAQIPELSNRHPRVVLVSDFSNGADLLLAHHPIATLPQLAGKRVGIEPASLGGYILHRAMEQAGLTPEQITIIPDNQLALEQAFLTGKLDAVVTYPPFASRLLRDPTTHTLFTSAQIPNEVVDVLVMDESILQKHQQTIDKLLEIWDKTLEWTRQHPQDAVTFMAQREGISFQEYQNSLAAIRLLTTREQWPFFTPGGTLHQLLSTIRRTLAREAVPGTPGHTTAEIIHGEFILRKTAP